MYRERKTWSSQKFGESNFLFGEDDVFQMKEFRTTLMYQTLLMGCQLPTSTDFRPPETIKFRFWPEDWFS